MPIYAYKCPACGHAQDVLQKMSASAPECPACGKATMDKQLTAAGFQLKGSGWYVTDFKGGNAATSAPAVATSAAADSSSAAATPAPAAPAPAPASSPAASAE